MLSKKAKSYRYHIMIKAGANAEIGPAVQEALKSLTKPSDVKISVDVNPTDTF
jgi:primosomal protein N'